MSVVPSPDAERRIRELYDAAQGLDLPSMVVEDASDPASPLHPYFEWDDGEAAFRWRLEQARRLIRGVTVRLVVNKVEVGVVAYVRNPDLPANQEGYVRTADLRKDKPFARRAVLYEFTMATSHLQRARNLATALGLEPEVDRLLGELVAVREMVEA